MGEKCKFYANVSSLHEEVTGSCHYVSVKMPNGEKVRFVVDCGSFQESKYTKDNKAFPFKPEKLDFALLTHTHIDHIGRVPLLYKKGFYGKTYISEEAYPFYKDALLNTAMIFAQDAKRKEDKSLIIYSTVDVKNTFNRIETVNYSSVFYPHPNIKVTCFENAHLIGASTYLVEISFIGYDPINLLFVGDISFKSNFKDVPDLPSYVYDMNLTVFTESTYGLTNTTDIDERFEINIIKALGEGKSIFIPAFSMQRTQEIMLKIRKVQDSKKIDKGLPIYCDGALSIGYTHKFSQLSEYFKSEARDFIPHNLIYVNKGIREKIINSKEQRIMISSSGMCSYGPAPMYIKSFISNPNYLIHLTGYSSEGSLSRQLFDLVNSDIQSTTTSENIIKISGVNKQKRCDVNYTFEFSSHAKKDELINFLNKFNNLKCVMISHGSIEAKQIFSVDVLNLVNTKDVAVQSRNVVFKISAYGLVKSYVVN